MRRPHTHVVLLSTLAFGGTACPEPDDRGATLTATQTGPVSGVGDDADGEDDTDDGDDDDAGSSSGGTADDGGSTTTAPMTTTTTSTTTGEPTDAESSSGAPADTGGPNAGICDPSPEDGDCNLCTKQNCCEQLTACDADVTCNCVISCVDDGGAPDACQSECGAAPLFDALTSCVISSCILQCL